MKGFKIEEVFDQSTFCLLPRYTKHLVLPRRVKAWDTRLYHKEFSRIHGHANKTLPFENVVRPINHKNKPITSGHKTDRLKKETTTQRSHQVRARPNSGRSIRQRSFISVQNDKNLCRVDSSSKVCLYLYRVYSICCIFEYSGY